MALQATSLNSGSNGNCYYIGNASEAVLIDGGLSCRETEKRMKRLNLDLKKVKGIFISHEHADHVVGVSRLSQKHNLPVYITPATERFGNIDIAPHLVMTFRAYEPVTLGNLSITAFPKFHDASDPHSFMVSGPDDYHQNQSVNIGVFTDIGVPCHHVIRHFKQCHAAFLESNYDEQLLEKGRYPIALKKRIRGDYGHLSNTQALHLFANHRPPFMSHLFLSHLSQHNNSPEIVQELFEAHAGNTRIVVASRHRETEVYSVSNGGSVNVEEPKPALGGFAYQMELFR
jgi:phosphoribosyl 1,2-cyclic phosphodiesterase